MLIPTSIPESHSIAEFGCYFPDFGTDLSLPARLAVYDSLLGDPLCFEMKMGSSCEIGTFIAGVGKCEPNSLDTLDICADQCAEVYQQNE